MDAGDLIGGIGGLIGGGGARGKFGGGGGPNTGMGGLKGAAVDMLSKVWLKSVDQIHSIDR